MRALLILLASLGLAAAAHAADGVNGRIIKVLPFLIDQQGRNAKSPSLFDRDAYQAYLREHTNDVAAMRFDVLWSASKAPEEQIKISVELRGVSTNSVPTMQTLQTNVAPGTFRRWTAIPLDGENYKKLGNLVAWRVTLWNGDARLGEQKSFLW